MLRTGPLFDNVEPERRNKKRKLSADLGKQTERLPSLPDCTSIPWVSSYGRDSKVSSRTITFELLLFNLFVTILATLAWCMNRGLLCNHATCDKCHSSKCQTLS